MRQTDTRVHVCDRELGQKSNMLPIKGRWERGMKESEIKETAVQGPKRKRQRERRERFPAEIHIKRKKFSGR